MRLRGEPLAKSKISTPYCGYPNSNLSIINLCDGIFIHLLIGEPVKANRNQTLKLFQFSKLQQTNQNKNLPTNSNDHVVIQF